MKKKIRYYVAVGGFDEISYREISFREAQRTMGQLRYGSCSCSKGCCVGTYDNLAQFAGQAKRMGHTKIYLDPAGPSAYAE